MSAAGVTPLPLRGKVRLCQPSLRGRVQFFNSPETRLCRLFRIRFHSTRGEPAGPFSEDSRQGLTTVVAMFGAQLHTHPPAAQLGEPKPIAFPPVCRRKRAVRGRLVEFPSCVPLQSRQLSAPRFLEHAALHPLETPPRIDARPSIRRRGIGVPELGGDRRPGLVREFRPGFRPEPRVVAAARR